MKKTILILSSITLINCFSLISQPKKPIESKLITTIERLKHEILKAEDRASERYTSLKEKEDNFFPFLEELQPQLLYQSEEFLKRSKQLEGLPGFKMGPASSELKSRALEYDSYASQVKRYLVSLKTSKDLYTDLFKSRDFLEKMAYEGFGPPKKSQLNKSFKELKNAYDNFSSAFTHLKQLEEALRKETGSAGEPVCFGDICFAATTSK